MGKKTHGTVTPLAFPPLKNDGLPLADYVFERCNRSRADTADRLVSQYFCNPKEANTQARACYDKHTRPGGRGDGSNDSDVVATPPSVPAAASPGSVATTTDALPLSGMSEAAVQYVVDKTIHALVKEGTLAYAPSPLKSEREEVLSDSDLGTPQAKRARVGGQQDRQAPPDGGC